MDKPSFISRTQRLGVQMIDLYNECQALNDEYTDTGGAAALRDADLTTSARGTPPTAAEFVTFVASIQAYIALMDAGHRTNARKVAA